VQVAAASSFDDLRLLFAQERDPAVLEVLAQALVSRSHVLGRIGEPTELRPLLDRLATEANPALRAAMIRPLGATIEPVSGLYARLIQDPVPEVREAVVANILAEQRVGYGHIREIAERAIAVAVAARPVDPEAGARILANVDIHTASTIFVDQVLNLLQANNPRLRAGTAVALGTVGAAEAQRVTQALIARYQTEPDKDVRKNILQGIVHLGFADAVPTLESLRGIDRALTAEIDLWIAALQLNRQEWETLLREKDHLAKARGV
jgi:HEAT repeat protein